MQRYNAEVETKNKLQLLKDKIDQIENLILNTNLDSVRQWREETLIILDHLIGEDSKYYKNFDKLKYRASVFSAGDVEGNYLRNINACKEDLTKAKSSLLAILFGIEKGLL